jgi:uncharacterized protein (TIGR02147 family)
MFAQQIGVSSGRLSELLSGKRRLTSEIAQRISSRLVLTPAERQELLKFVREDKNEAGKERLPEFSEISDDVFYAIADWQHFAILSLMETDGFEGTPEWVAERLNITKAQARESIERLQRLRLIVVQNGKWSRHNPNISTGTDVESIALKISHRQSIEQAIACLDEVPLELRDITSMTMAVDIKRIKEVKAMIKRFRHEVCAFLESGDSKDEVYNINIQLVPVSRPKNKAGA